MSCPRRGGGGVGQGFTNSSDRSPTQRSRGSPEWPLPDRHRLEVRSVGVAPDRHLPPALSPGVPAVGGRETVGLVVQEQGDPEEEEEDVEARVPNAGEVKDRGLLVPLPLAQPQVPALKHPACPVEAQWSVVPTTPLPVDQALPTLPPSPHSRLGSQSRPALPPRPRASPNLDPGSYAPPTTTCPSSLPDTRPGHRGGTLRPYLSSYPVPAGTLSTPLNLPSLPAPGPKPLDTYLDPGTDVRPSEGPSPPYPFLGPQVPSLSVPRPPAEWHVFLDVPHDLPRRGRPRVRVRPGPAAVAPQRVPLLRRRAQADVARVRPQVRGGDVAPGRQARPVRRPLDRAPRVPVPVVAEAPEVDVPEVDLPDRTPLAPRASRGASGPGAGRWPGRRARWGPGAGRRRAKGLGGDVGAWGRGGDGPEGPSQGLGAGLAAETGSGGLGSTDLGQSDAQSPGAPRGVEGESRGRRRLGGGDRPSG